MNIQANSGMISEMNNTLINFKIKANCIDAGQVNHFSFYMIRLDPAIRIQKLKQVLPELGLIFKSKSSPTLEVLSGEGVIRIQFAHSNSHILPLSDILSEPPKEMLFPCIFGRTDKGNPMWVDISKCPHLLVAGATGSGKSVFLHNLIANAIRIPGVDIYLSDPKQVEFSSYEDLAIFVARSYNDTLAMLQNLASIMEDRYSVLSKLKLSSYKKGLFSQILVVLDEVADLLIQDSKGELQKLIIRLAQKARAAGIYLVLATQRPSVDILSGAIKANFPARLACKVSSSIDSRVILDSFGAENLLGRGDALFKSPDVDLQRLQIAFVTPEETIRWYDDILETNS